MEINHKPPKTIHHTTPKNHFTAENPKNPQIQKENKPTPQPKLDSPPNLS
jgi:hypothetical protein